ncbi:type I toxin-antitoxin system ptaRNA1 family toxin, partial [Salmonella enterica]|nr:type I toxin-antitoxin system ptaRNA1 family toxin [Salmonella enterica]
LVGLGALVLIKKKTARSLSERAEICNNLVVVVFILNKGSRYFALIFFHTQPDPVNE